MKAKIERGKITFDIDELVESFDPEQRKTIARYVAADKQLFAAVLECVASDGLFGRFFTDDEDGDWWFDNNTLLELREKLLPLMTEVARGAVKEALLQRNAAKESEDRLAKWAWTLYHAWPDVRLPERPYLPTGYSPPTDPSKEEIAAFIPPETRS